MITKANVIDTRRFVLRTQFNPDKSGLKRKLLSQIKTI